MMENEIPVEERGQSVRIKQLFKDRTVRGKELSSIIFSLLVFFAGVISGNFVDTFLDELNKKYDVDIVMFSDVEGETFPIIIDNVGDKKLTNIQVNIRSCYLESPKIYFPPDLEAGQQHKIPFEDSNTFTIYSKNRCVQGLINLSNSEVVVTVYRDDITGKLFSPPTNRTFYSCAFCYWTVNITTNEHNENFREETYSSIPIISETWDNSSLSEGNFTEVGQFSLLYLDKRIVETGQGTYR